MVVLDISISTQSAIPVVYDRAHFLSVLKRLNWMRSRMMTRKPPQGLSFLDKVRIASASGRMDWIKGKVRWFIDSEELEKLKARIEVENAIGSAYPKLWRDLEDNAYRRMEERNIPEGKELSKQQKLSLEQWKLQIDPMLGEETPRHALPGGKERQSRHLRLLEIKHSENIVEKAEEVVEEIKLICKRDDYEVVPPNIVPAAAHDIAQQSFQ